MSHKSHTSHPDSLKGSHMKIIIAPNAFKESLEAAEAARAMAAGWRKVFPKAKLIEMPVADGGDGTAASFAAAAGARLVSRKVKGPLGKTISAKFAWEKKNAAAVIEMAQASGLWLVPPRRRNPMKTSTFGSGQLAAAALKLGARRVVVGLGGSATVDGGAGFAAAMGYRLLDRNGRPIGPGGAGLEKLARIVSPEKPLWSKKTEFLAATDVTNPLLGPKGAAAVFGPQKGATPAQVKRLEAALKNFSDRIELDLGKKVARVPGAGAAGGFGACLAGLFDAQLVSGIEVFLELCGFEKALRGADLVLTGEGTLDRQTSYGKAPMGVAQAAAKKKVPVIALAGTLGNGWETLLKKGFQAIFSITDSPITLDQAMRDARRLLIKQTEAVARAYRAGLESAK